MVISAINSTTIQVTFSDGNTETFQGYQLITGSNEVTFEYDGITFTETVNYQPSVSSATAVENIEFINYRNIRVTFNDIVDEASATDASNYYFEIVDGNSAYGVGASLPDLQLSNQLSDIETNYITNNPDTAADLWWNGGSLLSINYEANIVANTVDGKTVVDIYLPEDARFTNLIDDTYGDDDERTLSVLQRTSVLQRLDDPEGTRKTLHKNTTFKVAVRNVLDADGEASIDTYVQQLEVLDETAPKLLAVYKSSEADALASDEDGLDRNLGTFELLRTREYPFTQAADKLFFEYSEPVFDTHDLEKSDIDYETRDIRLLVNGKLIGASDNLYYEDDHTVQPLDKFLTFRMDKDATYSQSLVATLDAEEAVQYLVDTWGEEFLTGKDYTFKIIGVTDLAGNIEVSSQHSFTVNFVDDPANNEPPVTIAPEVLNITQVADNMFRVDFNRPGVVGKLQIIDADGNECLVEADIPESILDEDDGNYYSYVAVPAMDNELFDPVFNVDVKEMNTLAYDGQDYIYREVRAADIETTDATPLVGNDYSENMKLSNDIYSPVVDDAAIDPIEYDSRGTTLEIPVVDVVPTSWDDPNITYEVNAIKYEYTQDGNDEDRFTNNIDFENGDYLPIFVWYEDADGLRHSAVVHNMEDWIRPWEYDWVNAEPEYWNSGYEGSISFNQNTDILTLDLSEYDELLDQDLLESTGERKVVSGVTYNVEIPKGYFTDSARDILLTGWEEIPHNFSEDIDFTFGEEDYDLLYVDDARIPQLASLVDDFDDFLSGLSESEQERYALAWSLLGYTSIAQDVEITVEAEEIVTPEDPREYVPQTSKELIRYDEATDSVWVEFTGTIDPATLKDPNNYTVDGLTLAEWGLTSSDIVFDGTNGRQYAVFSMPQNSIEEDGDYSITVEGVSNYAGGTMTPVSTVVRLHDNYCPIVVEATVTAQREIRLTLNEPVTYLVEAVTTPDKYSAANNFKVMAGNTELTVLEAILPENLLPDVLDDSIIENIISNPDPSQRQITLKLGSNIPEEGDITVEIKPDQNGNILFIDLSTNSNSMQEDIYSVDRLEE